MNATADLHNLQNSLTLGKAETDILSITVTRYTTVAGIVIIIYDCLLTIGDEVKIKYTWGVQLIILFVTLQIRLVWPGPLTAAKLLYYINRYVSLVGVVVSNYRASSYMVRTSF